MRLPATAALFEVLPPHRAAGKMIEWIGPCDWGGPCRHSVFRDPFSPEAPVLLFYRDELRPLTRAAKEVLPCV